MYPVGARGGLLSPGASRHTVVPEKGPAPAKTGEPREPPPHRPVRSTVNACSVPPLTTILASCRSSSDDLERTPPLLSSDHIRGSDPRMTRRSSFRGYSLSCDHPNLIQFSSGRRVSSQLDFLISAFSFFYQTIDLISCSVFVSRNCITPLHL